MMLNTLHGLMSRFCRDH